MNPIISPWLFYFADMAGGVQFFIFVVVFATVVAGVAYLSYLYDSKLPMLRCVPVFCISFLFLIVLVLCPTTETVYKMAAASYVTTDNISSVVSNGRLLKEELKKDIIDIINESSESK